MTSTEYLQSRKRTARAVGYTLSLTCLYFIYIELSTLTLEHLNERCLPAVPWFTGVSLALCLLPPAKRWSAWPLVHSSKNSKPLWLSVGLAVPICLAAFFIPMFLIAPVVDLLKSDSAIYAASAAIPVLSAIMEEVGFRGILQGGLERHMTPPTAILMTTILFLAAHAGTAWFFRETIFYSTLSLACGLLATRSKSLLPSVILHVTINALGVVVTSQGQIDVHRIPTSVLIAIAVLVAFCIYHFVDKIKEASTT